MTSTEVPGFRDPRDVLARGYDRIAGHYAEWARDEVEDSVAPAYLGLLIDRLPNGAAVLDLGCGGGQRLGQLARNFDVTGVDISWEQARRAQHAVPQARVLLGNMTQLAFRSASFDAVTAFYAFTHLPHGELPSQPRRIADWLRPGGLLVASMGTALNTGTFVQDWLGAPTYFSGYDGATNRLLVERAGLRILNAREEMIQEKLETRVMPTAFLWVVAQRPER